MPWCPKCKTEYREGFTVCADCGSELVEDEPGDFFDEELQEEVRDGMREPNRDGVVLPDEESVGTKSGEPVGMEGGKTAGMESADAEDEESASMEGEKSVGMEDEESADTESEDDARQMRTGGNGLYQDSSERASDNRSSAWMLLGLGILGLIVVALGVVGILPLHLGNPYLFYGVMGAIFILFVVAGIVSMKNAKIFEKKAESENSLRQTLLDWCRDNLNAADIDTNVCAEGVSDEVAYFRRSSYIKEKLNHQFVNLNQGFLDQFIDDYIYDEIFGEKAE